MPRTRQPLPRGFFPLWTTVALDLIGFGIVIPILAAHASDFGADGFDVGLLIASYSLAQFVFSPIWGGLSDRIGRRPVLIVSLIGSALGSLLTGLAGGIALLFVARVIDGASGGTVAVAQAAATDLADESERPRLLGLLGAAFAIGFVIGPAIGGLAGLVDRRLPFFIAAALAAANAVATWFRVPETNATPTPRAGRSLRDHRHLLPLFGGALLAVSAFAGFEATFALLGEDRFGWSLSEIAFVFVGIGLYLSVVQGRLVGQLAESMGSERLLLVGLGLVGAGLFVLGLAEGSAGLVIALALLVGGQGLVSPSIASVVSGRAARGARGAALGLQQSASALGRVVGPVGIGAIYAAATPRAAYFVAAGLAVIAAVVVSSGLRQSTRVEERVSVGSCRTNGDERASVRPFEWFAKCRQDEHDRSPPRAGHVAASLRVTETAAAWAKLPVGNIEQRA